MISFIWPRSGDGVIRYFVAFVLVLALASTKVRADLVSYTLTATVQDAGGSTINNTSLASLPIAVGDRISWTLQYDRASPLYANESDAHENYYLPGPGPVMTNLVDRTTGFHVFTLSSIPSTGLPAHLELLNYGANYARGAVGIEEGALATPYFMHLSLLSNGLLPTLTLASLRLDQVAFNLPDKSSPAFDQFRYVGSLPNTQDTIYFDAQVNSLTSGPTTPEPGTLTLLALGFAGLAARRFRCAFDVAG